MWKRTCTLLCALLSVIVPLIVRVPGFTEGVHRVVVLSSGKEMREIRPVHTGKHGKADPSRLLKKMVLDNVRRISPGGKK